MGLSRIADSPVNRIAELCLEPWNPFGTTNRVGMSAETSKRFPGLGSGCKRHTAIVGDATAAARGEKQHLGGLSLCRPCLASSDSSPARMRTAHQSSEASRSRCAALHTIEQAPDDARQMLGSSTSF